MWLPSPMSRKRLTPLERMALTGQACRRASFLARRKQAGLVRIDIWVPVERADELRQLSAQWTRERLDGDG